MWLCSFFFVDYNAGMVSKEFFFSFFFFFVMFVSLSINSSVSNRNSTLQFHLFHGAKKKMMIHLGVIVLPSPRIVLSLPFFFIRRRRYIFAPFLFLYIIFQPNSLTLSVSRHKETSESKQATTTVVK